LTNVDHMNTIFTWHEANSVLAIVKLLHNCFVFGTRWRHNASIERTVTFAKIDGE